MGSKITVTERYLKSKEEREPELVALIRSQREHARLAADNLESVGEYKRLLQKANDEIIKLQSERDQLKNTLKRYQGSK